MSNRLHVVCLDAPSPPDYGGALDMHFKVKALAERGQRITLHYFSYRAGRGVQGLEAACEATYAYRRKSFLQSLPVRAPFIVRSRINAELIARLNADASPILLEGLHCAGLLPFLNNPARVVLRMHNDEPDYYRFLALSERSVLKRQYFLQEAKLLHRFQQQLPKNLKLACLSQADQQTFEERYGFVQTAFVPCFLPWQSVTAQPGSGRFCLYHGNLQVSENEQAALWLMRNVFANTSTPLVVAGRGASPLLQSEAARNTNVELRNNPTIAEIDALVREAHINVLPSLNNTGVKLKLLNALFNGRHCLTNKNGIKGSGLEAAVHTAEEPEQWREAIAALMETPFAAAGAQERVEALQVYNNQKNAEKLIGLW